MKVKPSVHLDFDSYNYQDSTVLYIKNILSLNYFLAMYFLKEIENYQTKGLNFESVLKAWCAFWTWDFIKM